MVSFWFIPLIMSAVAVLLAWMMYWADGHLALQNTRFIIAGGTTDVLRGILVAMATTILTTAGVVFTLLTLPLSTVAAQYGSRLLRIFLGDKITQFVLGMFVGTFVYCITAALIILPPQIQPEGPQITATFGMFLLLATFASLILLVQHISTMLQAPNIAAAAGIELMNVAQGEPRSEYQGDGKGDGDLAGQDFSKKSDGYQIFSKRTGYIKYIDPEYILTLTIDHDLVIRLLRKPGHFINAGMPIAIVWPADRIDEKLDKKIRDTFHLGNQRTPTQDVEYAVNQLSEMAVRAMSPAINDPFTAMNCLDYMIEGLVIFARRKGENPCIHDRDGRLRVIFDPVSFDELLNAAFNMLRHASCDNVEVLIHMLDGIGTIDLEMQSPEIHQKLLRHVRLIEEESKVGALIKEDRDAIRVKCESLQILGSYQ
ncbi:MAG TPA: DUF2254 domain-containing protein [Methanoregulaceae archaeon]|nr:DUF2254 domain-containing protein [Methanoregulaceae archaeon]